MIPQNLLLSFSSSCYSLLAGFAGWIQEGTRLLPRFGSLVNINVHSLLLPDSVRAALCEAHLLGYTAVWIPPYLDALSLYLPLLQTSDWDLLGPDWWSILQPPNCFITHIIWIELCSPGWDCTKCFASLPTVEGWLKNLLYTTYRHTSF